MDDFRKKGLGVAVITYDTVPIVADFAARQKITFPILADAQSKTIREFGVLNTAVPAGHLWEGVPYPGTFIVDAAGVVKSKYFEDHYQDRYAAPTILLREFGSAAGTRETTVNAKYLQMKYYASADLARPDLRFTLVADFVLPPKMHVYTPEVKDYIPIEFRLEGSPNFTAKTVEYPKGDLLFLPAINEIVPVYQNKFRITQDVVLASSSVLQPILNGDQTLKIRGQLRYQACDDKICYLPETIPMEWTLQLEPLNRERVPEAIQHKAASAPAAPGGR
ncbi:MAG: redoxin domain-containing protein [Acidobacteria bacterium]|nr:redoxin domain-containing protein [Acidobacteriota bacterium]